MHLLPFTALLNKLLAGPVTSMLAALGIHVANPHAPIADFVAMQVFVFLFALLLFVLLRVTLSVDKPNFIQHLFEGIHSFIADQGREIIGHHHKKYDSYLAALGIFILFSNLIGLVPAFESPTGVPYVPFGCALVSWVYYHVVGLKMNGFRYFLHFFGPVWWLAFLIFPIEIFSHLARVMSLTIRLFANMFAGEMVTMAFFSLIPLGLPIAFIGLHAMVAFVQAYIFVLLPMVYIAEATAHEH